MEKEIFCTFFFLRLFVNKGEKGREGERRKTLEFSSVAIAYFFRRGLIQ